MCGLLHSTMTYDNEGRKSSQLTSCPEKENKSRTEQGVSYRIQVFDTGPWQLEVNYLCVVATYGVKS